jgi:hypothetical protein
MPSKAILKYSLLAPRCAIVAFMAVDDLGLRLM